MESCFWFAKDLHIGYEEFWNMEKRDYLFLVKRLTKYYDAMKKEEEEIRRGIK